MSDPKTLKTAIHGKDNDVAIIVPSKPEALTVTYASLVEHCLAYQAKLAAVGIGHGSVVSIATVNSFEFVVSFLASAWQRAVAAPLNPAYKQDEFEFYIGDVNSALVLVPRGAYEGNAPAVAAAKKFNAAVAESYWDEEKMEVALDIKCMGKLQGRDAEKSLDAQPDDVALLLHTSGTTSRPKVVPLTHRNLTTTMKNITQTYELTAKDRTMLVMPLFHVHGLLAGLLSPLHSGGSAIIPSRFSASEFWTDFVSHQANWYTAVPTIHQILLRQPADSQPKPMPNIRFIRSCSSPLAPAVLSQLEKAFGAPVLEAYAMTEAAHQMTSNPLPARGVHKPGTVGVGQGVEVCIMDDNGKEVPQGQEAEICVRGANVTAGYLNNETANATAFHPDPSSSSGGGKFLRTGDQGKLDEDGYLVITGRIKELINKGGEKISPVELDNLLARHPAIAEVVCFAVPDEMYGQEIGAAVVLKQGGEKTPDEETLKQWVGERVAKFKIPRKIWFTDVMPKTATGKIQRRVVADTMMDSVAK